jgi:hypothetical protein
MVQLRTDGLHDTYNKTVYRCLALAMPVTFQTGASTKAQQRRVIFTPFA